MRLSHPLSVGGALLTALTLVALGCSKAPSTPQEQLSASYRSGDWISAVDLSTKLLEENPDDTEVLYKRGQAYLALEMFDESIADYSRLIQLQPKEPKGYYGRELAYRRSGQIELAQADASLVRNLDSQYKTAYQFEAKNFVGPSSVATIATDQPDASGDAADTANESDAPWDVTNSTDEELASDPATLDYSSAFPFDDEQVGSVDQDTGAVDYLTDPYHATPDALTPTREQSASADSALADAPAGPSTPKTQPSSLTPGATGKLEASTRLAENLGHMEALRTADNQADNTVGDAESDAEGEDVAAMIHRRLNAKRGEQAGPLKPGPLQPAPLGAALGRHNPANNPPEPVVIPQPASLSTALPTPGILPNREANGPTPRGMAAAPGVVAPRATGIQSAGNTGTGLPGGTASPGTIMAANPYSNLSQGTSGFQPGKFQGNTIYTPGSAQPILSTSLSGPGNSPAGGMPPQNMGQAPQRPAGALPRGNAPTGNQGIPQIGPPANRRPAPTTTPASPSGTINIPGIPAAR